MRLFRLILLVLITAVPVSAVAQNPFAARILIDDKVVTEYEVQQRARFLQLLNVPGDPVAEAEKVLIEDRLREIAADRLGIRVAEQQLRDGMAEFAGRANLSAEEFVTILNQNGVGAETFRDFVRAGITWREVVRGRFLGRAQAVSEADIDRALSVEAQRGTVRVLLSEIVLPRDARRQAEELADRLSGEAAFARAARELSTAQSAQQGGRIDWVPVPNLPAGLVQQLAALRPGQVTRPIQGPDSISIYLLRAVQQEETITPRTTQVEYAVFLIPGAGTPEAAAQEQAIRGRVDACGDLYGVAQGLPADRLTIETRVLTEVPTEIATELARLDVNEVSTRLTRGSAQMFLMLCARRVASDVPPDRAAVRERLVIEQLEGHARLYLEELRANAHIRRP
jgi:peptidyl-prolyl cis-trans isomerase SurA